MIDAARRSVRGLMSCLPWQSAHAGADGRGRPSPSPYAWMLSWLFAPIRRGTRALDLGQLVGVRELREFREIGVAVDARHRAVRRGAERVGVEGDARPVVTFRGRVMTRDAIVVGRRLRRRVLRARRGRTRRIPVASGHHNVKRGNPSVSRRTLYLRSGAQGRRAEALRAPARERGSMPCAHFFFIDITDRPLTFSRLPTPSRGFVSLPLSPIEWQSAHFSYRVYLFSPAPERADPLHQNALLQALHVGNEAVEVSGRQGRVLVGHRRLLGGLRLRRHPRSGW